MRYYLHIPRKNDKGRRGLICRGGCKGRGRRPRTRTRTGGAAGGWHCGGFLTEEEKQPPLRSEPAGTPTLLHSHTHTLGPIIMRGIVFILVYSFPTASFCFLHAEQTKKSIQNIIIHQENYYLVLMFREEIDIADGTGVACKFHVETCKIK